MAAESTRAILLVIPLYNHGATVREVACKAMNTGWPLLVIDDGSDDGGAEQLRDLSCTLITHPENKGKGTAISTAVRFAHENDYDAIITIDADGQHDPADCQLLVDESESSDWPALVIGERQMIQDTVPGSSHFGKNFSNFWVRLESGYYLPDTQSGLRLYPVEAMSKLKLFGKRYDFEIEILVKAAWAGVKITSVPVSVHYPPPSERISHFNKLIDNIRLSWLHTKLICRRLLPIPHRKATAEKVLEDSVKIIKNPLKVIRDLCLEGTSPLWLAVAVWFGLFLGALPLIACHTVVIIYITYKFQLNKPAAVAASQFCMPPVVPGICIEVGYYLRHGEFLLDLGWERWLPEAHYRLYDWFLGSLLVGPLLGFIGGGVVYFTAKKYQQFKLAR